MADNTLPPLPKDHLDHPEQWTTGAEPATDKQKGFVEVLQKQHPELVPEGGLDTAVLGKSEASEAIDKLRSGEKVDGPTENKVDEGGNVVEEGVKGTLANGHGENDAQDRAGKIDDDEVKPSSLRDEATNGNKRKAAATADAPEAPVETDGSDATGKDKHPSRQMKLDEVAHNTEASRPAKKTRTDGADTNVDSSNRETSASTPKDDPVPTTPIDLTSETDTPAAAINGNGESAETIPGDGEHLDHPENWATGDDPATDKQKGFIKVLEKQKGANGLGGNVDHLGKSEASEKIEQLKQM